MMRIQGGCFDAMALAPRAITEALFVPHPPAGATIGHAPHWIRHALVSDDQGLDETCVARACCGASECLLRFAGLDIGQLDARALYDDVRMQDYAGRDPHGMFIEQGLKALIRTGILPPDTTFHEARELGEQMIALEYSPLIQGHMTTRAWLQPPDNGYIDPSADAPHWLSSHCTLMLDLLHDGGEAFTLTQDSRGPGVGHRGCLIMHRSSDVMTRHHSGPFAIRAQGLSQWRGYERFLLREGP